MKEIRAYKVESTGQIFEDQKIALVAEFSGMMRRASQRLPHMGSFPSSEVFAWLSDCIAGGTYPLAMPELMAALEYYRDNVATKPEGKS